MTLYRDAPRSTIARGLTIERPDEMRTPTARPPAESRLVEMLAPKVGYLYGRRREFVAGEVVELDATLYQAFVLDLGIARSCAPPPELVPPALAGTPPSFDPTAESDGEPARPSPAAGTPARRPPGRPKKRG